MKTKTPDRIPPHNIEAEMAVLGCMLVDRELAATVFEYTTPSDFYAHVHETICLTIEELYNEQEPIDKITVSERLRRREQLEKVGGISYLSTVMDTVQSAGSATYYAKIVHEKAVLRRMIHVAGVIERLGFAGEEDVEGALDRAEQAVFAINQQADDGGFVSVTSLLAPTFAVLESVSENRGPIGISSGFTDIDARLSGFKPGTLTILAARPGMGKTSLALNIATAMAVAARIDDAGSVAVFSMEMTKEELMHRLLCSESLIATNHGRLSAKEWEQVDSAMQQLDGLPLHIDDSGGLTATMIRGRCRRLKAREGLSAVFIDYLQMMPPTTTSAAGNRNLELSEITRTFKAMAKELQVPVIVLSQLNRNVENRTDKRPMLADLRDSGAIEQDADVVAFLYRGGYYDESADQTLTEFIVAKHRNGPTGTELLRFLKEYTRFANATTIKEPIVF